VPNWWWFLLLSLASYRVWRLLAEDSILDGIRRRLLRLGDWTEEDGEANLPEEYHDKIADFVSCPYCFGFWISGGALALYSAIIDWPGWLEFFIAWFAISAVVAFFATVDSKLHE